LQLKTNGTFKKTFEKKEKFVFFKGVIEKKIKKKKKIIDLKV